MNFIIVADIRGVKYYIKVEKWNAHKGGIEKFSYQGLKNNATHFTLKENADRAMYDASIKSPWIMIIEKHGKKRRGEISV